MNKVNAVNLELAAPAVLLLITFPAVGQIGGSGSVQGVVSDPTGAVIPGATVVATNVATGVKTTRQTTDAGYYVISPLPAGEYTVTVSFGGFQTLVQERVIVDALSAVGFNATLKLGGSASEVTVSDTPPMLNTTDARLTQTIRSDAYTSLPLTMGSSAPRDPVSFVALMPGVTSGSNTAGRVMGAQDKAQEVYVEGMATTNSVLQGETRTMTIGASIEAVDQFQLESAGGSAIYAGQGSTNFVLKSGANEFHGAVYENIRNSAFDARGFFTSVKQPNRMNEFGGTLGGPIKKNKMFFFGSYGGYRVMQATRPTFLSVPTIRERNGDFGEFPVAIYDTQTTNCAGGPCTRLPFAGNVIPSNRLSAASKFLQSFRPAPTNGNIQSNYLGSVPVGFATNSVLGKVDVDLIEKHRFFAMFSRGKRGQATNYRNGNIPQPYTGSRNVTEVMTMAQARHTWVATNSLLNQISLGFSRFWVPISDGTMDSNCTFEKLCGTWMTSAGVKGLPAGTAAGAFPYMTFSGPNSPWSWRNGNSPAYNEAANNLTLQDNVQWTHGKHALTFGGQIQWLQGNEMPRTYGSQAQWIFSNTQTAGFNAAGTLQTALGNSYASYLLGAVNSATINDDWVAGVGARFRTYSWWVQDNVKLSSRLTLNLGLRHEIGTNWVEVKDRMSWLDPNLPNPAIGGFRGALMFAGNGENSCHCRNGNIPLYLRNFQPRIGLAYSLSNTTVIRARFSIMSTRRGATGGTATKVGTGLLGFSANPTFASLDSGITPAFYWDAGVPSYQKAPFFDPTLNTGFTTTNSQGGAMTYGDPDIGPHPPRYQNWNLSIQHALTSTLALGFTYAGSNGHYMGLTSGGARGIRTNQINPRYLALGNLLQTKVSTANLAAAQAIVPGISIPFANFSGTYAQMLRPFPQYSSLGDPWGDVGNANYNSLQIVVRRTSSRGLYFNLNYTLAKGFDDLATRSGYINEKAQSVDPTHAFNAMVVYRLPFGKGQQVLASGNPVVRAVVSNWQISGTTTFRGGTGLGTILGSCNLPNASAGVCYASYNPSFSGDARINGSWGSGDLLGSKPPTFVDKTAFASPAPFAYGNSPRTLAYGLRGPLAYNQNVSLRREFNIRESLRLTIQADSINVFNFVNFGTPALNITSTSFGAVTSQSNSPRVIQLSARITF